MGNHQIYFIIGSIIVVVLPQLILGGCVFGPDKKDLLALRDNEILGKMNSTLFALTNNASLLLGIFNPWNYLKTNYLVTPENYLNFTSMGGLGRIDWMKVLKDELKIPNADLLSGQIASLFSVPVFEELKSIAIKYSFSVGVFRTHLPQFHYAGINLVSQSNATFELDLSCRAGVSFVWALLTDVAPGWELEINSTFPKIATAVDKAFELYYRNHPVLGQDFVRANVVKSSDYLLLKLQPVPSNRTAVYLEIYFINSALENTVVKTLTNLSEVPAIVYNNEPIKVVNIGPNSHIIEASRPVTKLPTVTYPTLGITVKGMNSSTLMNETVTSSTLSLTSVLLNATNGTISTRLGSTAPVTLSTLNIQTFNDSLVSTRTFVSTHVSTVPGLSESNQTSTKMPSDSANATMFGSSSSNQASSTPNVTAQFSDLTTMSTMVSKDQNVPITTTLSLNALTDSSLANTVTTNYSNSPVVYVKNFTTTSQTLSPGNGTSIPGNNSGKNQSTNADGNTSNATKLSTIGSDNPPGSSSITGNGTTRKPESINSSTTLDPDPLFKAVVPVITKVYNDEFLLKKMGTMAPLMAQDMFYTITIPTSVVIVLIAVMCMLCLQIDCLPSKKKNAKILLSS